RQCLCTGRATVGGPLHLVVGQVDGCAAAVVDLDVSRRVVADLGQHQAVDPAGTDSLQTGFVAPADGATCAAVDPVRRWIDAHATAVDFSAHTWVHHVHVHHVGVRHVCHV